MTPAIHDPVELQERAVQVGQADQELRSLRYRPSLLGDCEWPEPRIRALAFWRWVAREWRKEGAVR